MSTVANAFAAALRAAGVERVYGLPGEDHLRILDALPSAGLHYVGARDECAAAIMAATEAQASGVPGVVLLTIAPGITNAINAIAHAWLDHVPLLVVCGQHAPERAPLIIRQGLDTQRLLAPLTRWTATASARIHQVLARALDTAMAPPGGPVLLELRDDVSAAAPLDRLADWPLLQTNAHTLRVTGTVLEQAIPDELRMRVRAAGRPAIVVGGSCPSSAATCAAIDRASHALAAPVFCSPAAMGVLGPEHDWFAGTFMNGNLEAKVLGRSDLILALGLDARDFFNAAWRYTAPVVAVNAWPDTQRFAPTQHQLVGDTAAIVEALVCRGTDASAGASAAALDSASASDGGAASAAGAAPASASGSAAAQATTAALAASRASASVLDAANASVQRVSASAWTRDDVIAYRASVERPFGLQSSAFTIASALRAARAMLPPETLVAVDAGFGKPLASYLWSAARPNAYFTAHGLSTMGYALPAANALALAYPSRPVVAFMGDGSLLMRASELSVAAELGIAPIYVVWMDGALAQIETKQLRQGLRPVGARLPELSCVRIAEAFGAVGVDVSSLSEFRAALGSALASAAALATEDARGPESAPNAPPRGARPTLIGARVDQACRGEWYDLLRG
jgi:acetolactate synthase I/II/III large subunit